MMLQDILDNSGGLSAEIDYKYPFMLGSVSVNPGAGVRWDSKDQMDYYFGVSSRDSQRSGLEKYRPDSGFSPFLSVEAGWQFAENWHVIAAGQILFLSKEIKDSPMVDKGQIFSAIVGLSYQF